MMARDRVNIFVSLFAVYLVYLFFVFGCCVCGKCQHSQPGVYFFFSRSSVCELFLTVSRPRQYKGGKGAASPDSYSLRHIVEGVWGAEAQFQTFKFIKFFLVCQKTSSSVTQEERELCRHYGCHQNFIITVFIIQSFFANQKQQKYSRLFSTTSMDFQQFVIPG